MKKLFILLLLISNAQATIYYVKPGAGSSLWDGYDRVYSTINAACSAAGNDDSIFVAEGTYAGGSYINLRRMLFGGFLGDGTETEVSDRGDPEVFRLRTVIDGTGSSQGFQCWGRNIVDGFYFYRCANNNGAAIQATEAFWYTIRNCVFDSCVCPDWDEQGWGSAVLFDVNTSAGPDCVINCIVFDCYSYCGAIEMRGTHGEHPNNTYLYVVNCTIYNIHGFAIEWSKVESTPGAEDWSAPPGDNPYVYNCIVHKVVDRGIDQDQNSGLTGWTPTGDLKNNVWPKSHTSYTMPSSNYCTGYANNAACVDSIGSICFTDSTSYKLWPLGNAIYFRDGTSSTYRDWIGAYKPKQSKVD